MARNRIKDGVPPDDLLGACFTKEELGSLRRLARSQDVGKRRVCVEYLQSGELDLRNRRLILDLLDSLIGDRSQYVRWGSLGMVGQFVESYPEDVWPIAVRWGSVRSRDIRGGIACCVLEHLLEYHFSVYFPRVKEIIKNGEKRFAYTLACCYKMGQAKQKDNARVLDGFIGYLTKTHAEVDEYLRSQRQGSKEKWLRQVKKSEELLEVVRKLKSVIDELADGMLRFHVDSRSGQKK